MAQNLMYELALMLRSIPPVIATSNSCVIRPSTVASIAASADAQAASVVKFGPWRLNRLATRPAMQFPSSPGIVSSEIPGSQSSIRARSCCSIVARTSAGSAAKLSVRSSSRASSGNMIRSVVRYCCSPEIALPMITAVRSRSNSRAGHPASISAIRVHATAHLWASSIASDTFGGIGSFQPSGFQSQSRTHPPIVE